MALDDFEDDYRRRVEDSFPTGGVAGPLDAGYPGYDGSGINPGPYSAPQASNPTGVIRGTMGPGYDLEAFRKNWTQSGDVNNAQGWLDQNRAFTNGVTLKGEKAYDPQGRFIADLVGNYSGADPSQRSRIFLDGIDSDGRPRSSVGSAVKDARAQAGKTPAPAPAANPFLTQIRKLIMDRMGAMSKDPSLDDPTLAAQNTSYARSRDRGALQEREAMAERAAAQGQIMGGNSSGSFDTELRSINEQAGEDKAAFGADLLGDEVQARRNEVNSLMAMALDSGDAESARMLSMELAKLDAQLRREGLSENARQFDSDLGQRRYMYDDTMGFNIYNRDRDDEYTNAVLGAMGIKVPR